ncbi:hypothetical protein [Hyphococcus sp.]|uniref:hypothetical protein n=1 Tax=Hyphococcus sp. TaxID=2038636 RepID=UPI0020847F51|nr:MAG: hypothetical protein DHS20C04_22520 [Marinicaulis sp.]
MRRRGVLAGLAGLAAFPARAQNAGVQPKALSGARFVLGDQEFLLADVIAPPLYTLTKGAPSHFEASRQALGELLSDALDITDVLPPTRWGVHRISAINIQGKSLQSILVAKGAVRVAPESADNVRITELLVLESGARLALRGVWALPAYHVFSADNASGAIGRFHLIEGRVKSAEKHGSRFYLNFGDDYRTDFTAGAASALYGKWLKAGMDLGELQNARVRIRGYVGAINGPSIDLKHPLQIERLG